MKSIIFASLIPIVLIGIAIMFTAPKLKSKLGSLITWRRSFIIAGIYLGILLVSVPTLYLLSDKGLIKLVETSKEAVNFESLLEGDFDKHPGLYKKSSQTFKSDSNKLTFNVAANMGNYRIFVERKDVDDGEIEVRTYTETQMTIGIDVTKLVPPPIVTHQKGTLILEPSQQLRLEYKRFNVDFTAEQWKNRNRDNGKATYIEYMDFGETVIYLRVPKSMDIDTENYEYEGQIQMLN